jgi:hypothetical protein
MGGPYTAPPQSTGENRIAPEPLLAIDTLSECPSHCIWYGSILPDVAADNKPLGVMPRINKFDTLLRNAETDAAIRYNPSRWQMFCFNRPYPGAAHQSGDHLRA